MVHSPSIADGNPDPPISILAVVVLYKMIPTQSSTVRTLLKAIGALPAGTSRLQILVVDNTPGGQDVGPLPEAVSYKAAPHNPGLAVAYNYALRQAVEQGYSWLLTLDQDTSLPSTFLIDMLEVARRYVKLAEVAVVVPRIFDRGKVISPFRFVGGWFPSVVPDTVSGLSARHTSALNSGSLFNVQVLHSIGGYDEHFPLHNSDTRIFQRLDVAGKRVVIAGKVLVPHELSILDRQNRILPARYRSMLIDECDFWDRHMNFAGRAERFIRLAGRIFKGALQGEGFAFQKITVAEMWRRASTAKRQRIQERNAAADKEAVIWVEI